VTLLLDDQHLGRVLRGDAPPAPGPVFTTGYWYVRLCQAVINAGDHAGTLSRPFEALPPSVRERAVEALLELPPSIGLLSLRELAPVIGRLRQRHDLNILGMEALAAAVQLGATVWLSAPSPRLEAALRSEGLQVVVTDFP
jgi:hypothetical protein